MSDCLRDPRRHGRVPMSGDMKWRSGLGAGVGEVLEMSACGASLRVPVVEAFQVGPSVALNMKLGKGPECCLADDATVRYKMPSIDGTCRIGVEFSPLRTESEPSDETTFGVPVSGFA